MTSAEEGWSVNDTDLLVMIFVAIAAGIYGTLAVYTLLT